MDQTTPPVHSRTLTYLLVALGVCVLGAGVYGYVFRDQFTDFYDSTFKKDNTTANANTTNRTANVNTIRFTNLSLPEEVKGTATFSGTLTFGTASISLSSYSRVEAFSELKAATGKTLLVIYIDQVTNDVANTVMSTITSSVSLSTSAGTIPLRRYRIAGEEIKNDRGYLLFEVPTTAKNLTIVNGEGPLAQRVTLPS